MATSNNIISLRRHDLDNLRTGLTALVVAHHTAVAYGGSGYWRRSVCVPPDSLTLPLLGFNAFNQSFFMGLFYVISGRVSAQSLARAERAGAGGRWSFVRSKLLRLGMPALVYTLGVQPLVRLLIVKSPDLNQMRKEKSALDILRDYFESLRGIRGPVWYTATLMLFDLGAALLKPNTREGHRGMLPIDYRTLAKWGWIAAAGVSFLVRTRYPVGEEIELLGLQPGYAPQYVFAYVLGHMWYDQEMAAAAAESQPLLPGAKAEASFAALELPLAASVSLSTMCLLLAFQSGRGIEEMLGGWNYGALAYSIWNEASFALMAPALLSYCGKYFSSPASSRIFRPRYSYATFLAHALVSVVVEVGLDQLAVTATGSRPTWMESFAWRMAGPVFMTVAISTINIVASFEAGRFLVDYVPGLGRIL
ncbi:hypothetical protein GQ53DRAFT_843442 [Thozetella sp. PMI_491]|nr:hypothetical protein GQ53DRAFT_843442 [Thozetella sp. PMI_491]